MVNWMNILKQLLTLKGTIDDAIEAGEENVAEA